MDELLERFGRDYNPPPPTPHEEVWSGIEARLGARETPAIDLAAERRRRAGPRTSFAWAAAAAAVLVLGIGIGRMSAPAGPASAPDGLAADVEAPSSALSYAAGQHLERTELLLRLVRNDATRGDMHPLTRGWAHGLLVETRLLLDAGAAGADPAMTELLEDLELVLAQIVGAAGEGVGGGERERSELVLALGALERRELLSRIEAVTPVAFAGT